MSGRAQDDRRRNPRPGNIWEAVTTLRRLEQEREIARRQGEAQRDQELRREQAGVWQFVRGFAEELVRRGEAPERLVKRLWQAVGVAAGYRKVDEERVRAA